MKVLAIDLGTYSVKFLSCHVERKSIVVEKTTCIPIDLKGNVEQQDIEDKQFEIIQKYLKDNNDDSRRIFQIPAKWLTARFLSFPVSGRKKAEQMLPFQLDRELPFNLSNAQYASQFIPKRNAFFTLTSIIDLNRFDQYFRKLETLGVIPDIITSEVSVIQSYIQQKKLDGPFAVLDVGHETTKAFFVHDKKVVSAHLSHIAGKSITETIANTYKIPYDEAEEFKLNKSFFLTESQYDEVNEDQKVFAHMMDALFTPLIMEFKRWELGHRILYDKGIQTVYLCGGSTHIKNFNNYLAEKLSTSALHLDILQDNNIKGTLKEEENYISHHIPYLMVQTIDSKIPPINFRKGIYSSGEQTEIPFYSAFFIGIRALVVAFIILVSLLFERVFLLKEEKNLEVQITKLIKRSELNILKRDQRLYQRKPELILNKLKSRYKDVENEISLIQEISKKNAILPLVNIRNSLKADPRWFITSYEKNGDFITIEFECKDKETYDGLKTQLSFLPYKNVTFKDNSNGKLLHLEFEDSHI